ncbi:nucleotidyltransferase [Bacteroidia bacterium]|nr:nucleotidyltransferase [Bacteroidia bacterium]
MKPTLLILAAGMGSRYGGLKQIDQVGPSGETIMDYSVYDAVRAGFGKVVFVIRKDFETDFRNLFEKRFGNSIEVDFVFQSIADVPAGSTYNPERSKPWGTNHAVLMAADAIHEPFAVINADDFYGQESFAVLSQFLQSLNNQQESYCMVAYQLDKTLSESGAVSRGICKKDGNENLVSVEEYTHILQIDGKPAVKDADGSTRYLDNSTPVSMNMWGFTPRYFAHSQNYFKGFLAERGQELKSEFFIPLMVDKLIRDKTSTVKVLNTAAQWFGVTYPDDKPAVVASIQKLVHEGKYPQKLWV